jgi:hypothetical protein
MGTDVDLPASISPPPSRRGEEASAADCSPSSLPNFPEGDFLMRLLISSLRSLLIEHLGLLARQESVLDHNFRVARNPERRL